MKPAKISFHVVDATGWEEGYPARDLELHNPWVKGWRAPRYCLFPQEVVLSLPSALKVETLQILSHQYLIASKVDVLVGQAREGRASVVPNVAFSCLGYVTFGDNHSSSFRTRELKSIALNVSCRFIKLRFHQNHINHLNPFNQVGVVAVNVIGEATKATHQQQTGHSREAGLEGRLSHDEGDENNASPSYLPGYRGNQLAAPAVRTGDDLAFAIYQDPETGGLIRHLQRQKEVAVSGEDFSRAKLLKQAIVDLQKVGEVLAQLVLEKQRAIETENYEVAKECKERTDRLRMHMYRQLDVFGLVEDTSVMGRRACVLQPEPTRASSVSVQPQEDGGGVLPGPSPSLLHEKGNDAPPVWQTSCPGVVPTAASIEDRPLPTLVNKGSAALAVPRQDKEDVAVPDKLNDFALNEATLPIQIFGMELVECVYAKQFTHRERALRELSTALAALTAASPRKDVVATAKAIAILLRRLLVDKMAAGFQTSCGLLIALFDSVDRKLKRHFSSLEIEDLVSKTFPVLLGRLGDSAPRVVQQAIETVMELLKNNSLADLPAAVADQLTQPLGKKAAWRALLSRLTLLQQVVEKNGVKGQLTARKVMQVVRPSLEHSNGQVRDAAVQVTLELYRRSPTEVKMELPVDTPTLRKSLLWRTLMERLDQFDGKPSPRELKVAKQEKEKAMKDELAHVQKELSGLRQLADHVADDASKNLLSDTQREVHFRPSPSSRRQDGRQEEEEHACTFCGATGSEFAEEAQLNRHYLQYCAMLYQCPHCTQVVEIAALHEHWLTECSGKGKFRKCPRCREAVLATQYPMHITAKTCRVPSKTQRRCALCQMSIANDDEGWRSHLMGTKSCKNNPRKPQNSLHNEFQDCRAK